MRRWILVCLCSLGVSGGACSARSLLTIKLTAEPHEGELAGLPRIDVTRPDDTPVHDADGKTIIVVEDDDSTLLGVYLPAGVEGDVKVKVTLVTDDCPWSGQSPTVRLGHDKQADVALVRNVQGCLRLPDAGVPMTDAGADAGPDGTDARADAGPVDAASTDAPPTLLQDGATEVADTREGGVEAMVNSCSDYCNSYLTACAGWSAGSLSHGDCISFCKTWIAGDGTHSTGEDSLACRMIHLRTAADDPGRRCSECPAASPESIDVCSAGAKGSPPRDACPPEQLSDAGPPETP